MINFKRNFSKISILFGYFIVACVFVLITKPVYLLSILIVLFPPTILNIYWLKKSRFKIVIFSLVATFLFAPAVELISRLSGAWDVQSIIFRPFGLIPIENMIFALLNFLWVLSFYELFVDDDDVVRLSPKFRYLIGMYVVFAAIIFGFYFYNKDIISANYWMMSVPVLLIPALIIYSLNPHLAKKAVLPTLFFAVIFFVYEMISLYIGSWWWPGEYLYPVMVFGKVFPIDDVIIWYFLSTPALIGGYEFFADDFK